MRARQEILSHTSASLQVDTLRKIFRKELGSQESSLHLKDILTTPDGMETFCSPEFNGKIVSREIGDWHPGQPRVIAIYSSMSQEGHFIPTRDKMFWKDITGKRSECITIIVAQNIATVLKKNFAFQQNNLSYSQL